MAWRGKHRLEFSQCLPLSLACLCSEQSAHLYSSCMAKSKDCVKWDNTFKVLDVVTVTS